MSKGVRLRFAAGSCAGRNQRGVPKTCQDTYSTSLRIAGLRSAHLFAVYDGHGRQGHHVSEHVSQTMARLIETEIRALELDVLFRARSSSSTEEEHKAIMTIAALLKHCCNAAEASLRDSEIDSSLSGTTACVVLLLGRHCLCANVGDSRCVLGYDKTMFHYDREESELKPCDEVRSLTTDQKPDAKAERERIEKKGGNVHALRDSYGNFIGPARVWNANVGGHIPGLAMSRSIGDEVAGAVGVCSDPVVSYHYLRPGLDRCLVIASDGVWEFMENDSVIKLAMAHADPTDAVVGLCRAAQQSWIEKMAPSRSFVVDDITAIVLHLWPPAAPKPNPVEPVLAPVLEDSPVSDDVALEPPIAEEASSDVVAVAAAVAASASSASAAAKHRKSPSTVSQRPTAATVTPIAPRAHSSPLVGQTSNLHHRERTLPAIGTR